MKNHVKIYFDYFNYGEQDIILCTNCGNKACDIHHIEPKGMGGSKLKDRIDNLIALCRKCHELAHTGYMSKENLKLLQKYKMINYDK